MTGKGVKAASYNSYHTCAIGSDNLAYCAGNNGSGRLGNGSTVVSYSPVSVNTSGVLADKTINLISVGADFSCAVADDGLPYCWGANNYNQLGNGSATLSNVPVAVNTGGVLADKTVKHITTGDTHTCVVASDNLAYCWGYNSNGRLGNKSTSTPSTPVAVAMEGDLSGKTIKSISAGGSHTCAIASDDLAYCWGSNMYGQLGTGGSASSSPVAVKTDGDLAGKTIKSISAGANHTCVVASDRQAYCWGLNSYGQLGNGTKTQSPVPMRVSEP